MTWDRDVGGPVCPGCYKRCWYKSTAGEWRCVVCGLPQDVAIRAAHDAWMEWWMAIDVTEMRIDPLTHMVALESAYDEHAWVNQHIHEQLLAEAQEEESR